MRQQSIATPLQDLTTKYYIEYFAFYALLMKLGIKCEIHDCTIEMAGWLERKSVVPENTFKTLDKDKEIRIDNQYYLKNRKVDIDMETLRRFVLEMKTTAEKLKSEEIEKIRTSLFGPS